MDKGLHFKRAVLARSSTTGIELLLFPEDGTPQLPDELRVEVEFAGGLGREVCVARLVEQDKRWYIVKLTPAHFPSLCEALIRPSCENGQLEETSSPIVTTLTIRLPDDQEVTLECHEDPLFLERSAPQGAAIH